MPKSKSQIPEPRPPSAKPGPHLQAGVDLAMLQALLARHLTAPFEDAVAVGPLGNHTMLVAPTAAQQIAAVLAHRCGIAFPVLRAQRSGLRVRCAKVSGIIRIDQLVFVRRLRVRRLWHKTVAVVP